MSATEVLSALDRIHGTVSVIGSMNADYTVTAQRLPGPGETITGGPLQLLPGGKSGNQAAPQRASAQPCRCSARSAPIPTPTSYSALWARRA